MNIMLVSVSDRTVEIGVRRSLGATRQAILSQFVTEAVLLCLVGGIVGIAGGVMASTVLAERFEWVTAVTGGSIVLAFTCAVATGLASGVWPAWRAAHLNPVDALRHA